MTEAEILNEHTFSPSSSSRNEQKWMNFFSVFIMSLLLFLISKNSTGYLQKQKRPYVQST
jgi:hypothetical protein